MKAAFPLLSAADARRTTLVVRVKTMKDGMNGSYADRDLARAVRRCVRVRHDSREAGGAGSAGAGQLRATLTVQARLEVIPRSWVPAQTARWRSRVARQYRLAGHGDCSAPAKDPSSSMTDIITGPFSFRVRKSFYDSGN